MRTRLKVAAIDEAVTVDRVRVAPGDLIVADGTGVVCLPRERALDITARAETLQRDDERAMAEIRGGLGFTEAMQKFTRI